MAVCSNPMVEKAIQAMLCSQRDAWEQGVAAQALLEWGDDMRVIQMAHDAVLRQDSKGRLAIVYASTAVTDPAANGEPVLFAYQTTGDDRYHAAAEKMLKYLLHEAPRTQDGVIHHITHAPQLWIDSMYMLPPFLAAAGQPVEALHQVEGMRRYLWDADKMLFSHIWDDGKKAFERRDFWGVGNGWAAAGMVRVLRKLPLEMSAEKEHLIGYIQAVIDGCLAYQRFDGLFHDVVDNPSTFIETNLAQMLAYTIYRGAQAGWLDSHYLEYANRMRAAAHAKVDEFGYVQGVCGAPFFESPGTATEGQAFFILMEAAYRDLKIG